MSYAYKLSSLKIPAEKDPVESFVFHLCKYLSIPQESIQDAQLLKVSLDARKKPWLFWVCQIEFSTKERILGSWPSNLCEIEKLTEPSSIVWKRAQAQDPVVIVGSGPAGLFAALVLAEAGQKVVIVERGKPVETRMKDIGALRAKGDLNPESNICFGEGGAGTYTDGKLYSRVKHPYVEWMMERLVNFGASESILVEAHPHLGTDKLVQILQNMREHLNKLGVEYRFESKMNSLILKDQRVCGVLLENGDELHASKVILGVGHSARDTYETLHEQGVAMEAKPFAVGGRIEHPQVMVNRQQYGCKKPPESVGAAAYALTYQHPIQGSSEKRGVYSFCMCPGGFIVPSPTEPDRMVVNGMSNSNRSTPFANSGVVAQVFPKDLIQAGYEDSPLIGIQFQRDLESKTFKQVSKPYYAPAMRTDDFVNQKLEHGLAETNFRPGAEAVDLQLIFPDWILEPLRKGLLNFNRKIKGFVSERSNFFAVESRTSSPVRITRNEAMESISTPGLYPVGEGAGYAGGIVSAAVDGMKAANAILELE